VKEYIKGSKKSGERRLLKDKKDAANLRKGLDMNSFKNSETEITSKEDNYVPSVFLAGKRSQMNRSFVKASESCT
jgi:hypothetical protein